MRNSVIVSLILCGLSVFFSCERDKEIIPDAGENIFPTGKGRYVISEVYDTTFNTAGIVVDKYIKKEELGDTFTDLDNRNVQRVNVFRSAYELGENFQFEPFRVWGQLLASDSTAGEYYAERIEENNRFLVLRFPIFSQAKWNGNLFNTLGNQIYEYHSTDTTVFIRNQQYDDCVMVVQRADTNSFITYSFIYEIYAPNIGKIKRFEKTLVNDGPNGEFNSSESRIYIEEILSHN
ncbi:MAG: hypothetical protein AAF655_21000 [Bacteroidota bacterium]